MLSRVVLVFSAIFLAVAVYLAVFAKKSSRAVTVPGEYAAPPPFEWPERNKTLAFSPGLDMGSDSVRFTDPDPPKVTCLTSCA